MAGAAVPGGKGGELYLMQHCHHQNNSAVSYLVSWLVGWLVGLVGCFVGCGWLVGWFSLVG